MNSLSERIAAISDICPKKNGASKKQWAPALSAWADIRNLIPASDRFDKVDQGLQQAVLDEDGGHSMIWDPSVREHLIKLSIWMEGYEDADASAR